jgi:Putative DNA-binding domain
MNGSLESFQDAFADALFDAAPDDERMVRLHAQPGFAVYRNTVFKGCVDALQANFPAVVRLVGERWFRSTAAAYVREHAPADARLVQYGADFPAFLEAFEPARGLPYLAGVARLDALWVQAHTAADDVSIDAAAVAAFSAEALGRAVLRPHAAARWIAFDTMPAFTIWCANREGREVPGDLVWQGERALLLRALGEVTWMPLSAAGYAFLDACAEGLPFDAAAARALDAQPDAALGDVIGGLLAAGTFSAVETARR